MSDYLIDHALRMVRLLKLAMPHRGAAASAEAYWDGSCFGGHATVLDHERWAWVVDRDLESLDFEAREWVRSEQEIAAIEAANNTRGSDWLVAQLSACYDKQGPYVRWFQRELESALDDDGVEFPDALRPPTYAEEAAERRAKKAASEAATPPPELRPIDAEDVGRLVMAVGYGAVVVATAAAALGGISLTIAGATGGGLRQFGAGLVLWALALVLQQVVAE